MFFHFSFASPSRVPAHSPRARLRLVSPGRKLRSLARALTLPFALRRAGILGLLLLLGHEATAQTILGSTGDYAVMAGGTVTISGTANTAINGNLGSIGGIAGPGSNYTFTNGSQLTTSAQNQTDFTRAFSGLSAMPATGNLTGMTLGTTAGATILTPGVYRFDSTAQLTGALILDAQNQTNAVWVFQIGSTLTTSAASSVTFINLAANSSTNDGLFWQVGSATTLGANSTFAGNILGGTTINFGTAASLNYGRALTGSGTIGLDGDTIDYLGTGSGYSGGLAFTGNGNEISAAAVPEPATEALLAASAVLGLACWRRRHAAKVKANGVVA